MRSPARLSAFLTLAVLVGCSSSSTKSAAPAVTSSAAAPSSAAASAGAATGTVTTAAFVARAQSATIAKGSSMVTTTVTSSSGLSLVSTGAYDYRTGAADVSISTTEKGHSLKQRVIISKGFAYASLPGTSRYIRLNVSGLTGGSGGSSYDQVTSLNMLLGATDSLHKVGSEAVRGVSTTHFTGTLDLSKALAAIKDPKRRAAIQKMTSLVKTPNSVPVQVWIDKDGLCRRLTETVAVPAQKLAGISLPASTVRTTTEFYDFGVAVHVTPPAASKLLKVPTG